MDEARRKSWNVQTDFPSDCDTLRGAECSYWLLMIIVDGLLLSPLSYVLPGQNQNPRASPLHTQVTCCPHMCISALCYASWTQLSFVAVRPESFHLVAVNREEGGHYVVSQPGHYVIKVDNASCYTNRLNASPVIITHSRFPM